ncbi:hypothetical protein HY490_03285 [Candidatus Woesearchaeota archaeon]|nr:hypothetical protein [Candidatus Woesearchaeota archaeon]
MQKRFSEVLLLVVMLGIMVNVAYAAEESVVKQVWETIVWLFALGWITESANPFTTFVAFARFTLAIVTFVVVYELMRHWLAGARGFAGGTIMSKRAQLVVSLAISILSSAFFPTSLLLTIVVMYGTFVAFAMVFVPVLLALWLAFALEVRDKNMYWVRIVFLVIAIWLLRILAGWAEFTAASEGMREFITRAPDITAEQGATFLVTLTQTLSVLSTFANFATFLLVLAILYNLSGALEETPGAAAAGHGRGFFDSIGEAFQRKGERWVEETAKGIEYPDVKKRVEPALNSVIHFLRNIEDELQQILTARQRPRNIQRAVQGVLDTLQEPLRTLSGIDTIQGYDTAVDRATLPPHLRAAYTAAAGAAADGHTAFTTAYGNLCQQLEHTTNGLLTAAQEPNAAMRRAFERARAQEIANCIYLIQGLLAHNRLQYRAK